MRCFCKSRRHSPGLAGLLTGLWAPGRQRPTRLTEAQLHTQALMSVTQHQGEGREGNVRVPGRAPCPPSICAHGRAYGSICCLLLTDHLLRVAEVSPLPWQHKHSPVRFHFYLCSGMGLGRGRSSFLPALLPLPQRSLRLWPGPLPPLRSTYGWKESWPV